jgi:hypothetical protein
MAIASLRRKLRQVGEDRDGRCTMYLVYEHLELFASEVMPHFRG